MKQSELLRKQADMMDMAEKCGIDDWRGLVMVSNYHLTGYTHLNATRDPELQRWSNHRFALAVVEGKPVFEGDILYRIDSGEPCSINTLGFRADLFIWNPPKPKTVMIELLVEDAEKMSEAASERLSSTYAYDRVGLACRKALESQGEQSC